MKLLTEGARPLWLAGFALLGLYAVTLADAYAVRLLTIAGIWALVGLGYQLVFGHVGALSLAQGAFYGCGAYAAALAATSLGLPLPLGLLLAMAVPALLAALAAIPVLRLETHYFALATIGIAQVVHLLAINWESVTGGANGLAGVPAPSLLGYRLAPGGLAWLALVWTLVALAGIAIARIVDGLPGRALALLREHPMAASSLGIDTGRWRLAAFVAGAALAGLGGGLAAHTVGVVSPDVTDLPIMVACLTLVVVGGRRHVAGAVLGAILIVHLPEWFRFLDRYWLVAYGLATLAIVIAAPDGIAGFVDRWWPGAHRRRNAEKSQAAVPGISEVPTRQAAGPALTAQRMSKRFGGVQALDDVSIELRAGEIVGLIGPNGSGKSTLVNLVTGIERADRGSVLLAGTPVGGLPAHRIAALGIARSFQGVQLPGALPAIDNVAVARTAALVERRPLRALLGAVLARDTDPALAAARADALAWLARAGIARQAARRGDEVPPGVRRLTEVARALASRPVVLLLDEPAAGLDEAERGQLQALVRLAADSGIAVLVIEHALSFLLPLAGRVICLDRGRIVAEGPPEELRRDPRLAAAYFGLTATGTATR